MKDLRWRNDVPKNGKYPKLNEPKQPIPQPLKEDAKKPNKGPKTKRTW